MEEPKMSEAIGKGYDRVKYRSFMNQETTIQIFDKGLKNEYDSYFLGALKGIPKDPKELLSKAVKYIDCNKKHLVHDGLDPVAPEEECTID